MNGYPKIIKYTARKLRGYKNKLDKYKNKMDRRLEARKMNNKNSLEYKMRNFTGRTLFSFKILHYIALIIIKNIVFLIMLVISFIFGIWNIVDHFSASEYGERGDSFGGEILSYLLSCIYMFTYTSIKIFAVIFVIELLVPIIGEIIIYFYYYKGFPGPKWLRRLKK